MIMFLAGSVLILFILLVIEIVCLIFYGREVKVDRPPTKRRKISQLTKREQWVFGLGAAYLVVAIGYSLT